jgi:ATP-dependent protease HslVU (ClpYQ) peptidase subunit
MGASPTHQSMKPGSNVSNMSPMYKQRNPEQVSSLADIISPELPKSKTNHGGNFTINEMQDLQEQTAEDAEDIVDDLIRRSEQM